MIVPTEEIQTLLESKGFRRDETAYTYVGYQGENKRYLIIDESFAIQDTNMLIEDCEIQGASDIAEAIRLWVKDQSKS